MYLRECLIKNVGPIAELDVSLSLDNAGNPKPLILVGKNGTGKTIVLAYIIDALAELAKRKFRDITIGQQMAYSPYFKFSSGGDIRSLSGSSLSLLEFSEADCKFCYVEKVGKIDPQKFARRLKGRFESVQSWPENEPLHKMLQEMSSRLKLFLEPEQSVFFHPLAMSVRIG